MTNRKKRMHWISLAGEGAGVVDEEGAAAEDPSEGDGPDQKPSGSCKGPKKNQATTCCSYIYMHACINLCTVDMQVRVQLLTTDVDVAGGRPVILVVDWAADSLPN